MQTRLNHIQSTQAGSSAPHVTPASQSSALYHSRLPVHTTVYLYSTGDLINHWSTDRHYCSLSIVCVINVSPVFIPENLSCVCLCGRYITCDLIFTNPRHVQSLEATNRRSVTDTKSENIYCRLRTLRVNAKVYTCQHSS